MVNDANRPFLFSLTEKRNSPTDRILGARCFSLSQQLGSEETKHNVKIRPKNSSPSVIHIVRITRFSSSTITVLLEKLQWSSKSSPPPFTFSGHRYSLILSTCISSFDIPLRMYSGRSLHIQLVGHRPFLATSYFISDDSHLYLICLIQVLL